MKFIMTVVDDDPKGVVSDPPLNQVTTEVLIIEKDLALPFDEFIRRYFEPAFVQLKQQREYKRTA